MMLIRKIRVFIRSKNMFSILIAIVILYVTTFFILEINHAYSQTVSSRDSESTNDDESIKMSDQVTEEVIKSKFVIITNNNRISPVHDMNNVNQFSMDNSDQVDNTGYALNDIPNVKLKINDEEQFKVIISNKTEFASVTDRIYEKQLRSMQRDAFLDVSIKMVNNRTFVSQMLSSWKNEALFKRIDKRHNFCASLPGKLVGHMDMDVVLNTTDVPDTNRKLLGEGGVFRPNDCSPRERTAIIIPYRDREKNLQVLLAHLHRVLQRQMIEYGIFVIEMAPPTQFNRGLLANVGFLTASSIHSYTCYIIHDVDLLMTDDRNIYRCGRVPRHLTASNTKYSTGLPYMSYFGGIEAFTPEQFWKVNGFSNLYFGWGGEDDDMVYRIFYTGQYFSRPKLFIGGYVAIEHSPDSTNPINPNRRHLLKTAKERISEDGLRSVMYQRLALELKPLYTWAYVSAHEAKIMQKYQHYLED